MIQLDLRHTTPLTAGLHAALAMALAGVAGGHSHRLASRLGAPRLLLLSLGFQLAIALAMAAWLHPLVALLLLARSVPDALQRAPLNNAIAPLLPSHVRATYLSLQSLAGRLAFALLLLSLAPLSHDLHAMALRAALVLAVGAGLLAVTARRLDSR